MKNAGLLARTNKTAKLLARSIAALALAGGLVTVGACGMSSEAESAQRGDEAARPPAYAPEVVDERGKYAPRVNPSDFVKGVDNPYFPLVPGTTFVFEGKTEDGVERIEDSVTHDTREVLGVECVVLRDRVYLDGELIEDTFDWYAQDKKGNVWYFGEDTKELENGDVVTTAGSWEAGKDGARPGIIMQANPRVGDSYRQEYYKGEAEDMAEVLSLNEEASVPHGSFVDVLMTRDWTPLEPGILEHKYYASGVGPIGEAQVVGGSDRIDLVEIRTE